MSLIITFILSFTLGWMMFEIYQLPPIPKPSDDIMAGGEMRAMLHKMTGIQIILTLLVVSMLILRIIGI